MLPSYLIYAVAAMAPLAACTIVPFPSFIGNNGFGGSADISPACAAALNSTIDCDADLDFVARTDTYMSPEARDSVASICVAGCNSSLTSYLSGVVAECGASHVIDEELPNTVVGELLQGVWELMCTRDSSTGQLCPGLSLRSPE
jgi:hypothetical protein